MVDETDPQAGASKAAKRSRRTKKTIINDKPDYKSDDNDIGKRYSFHTLAKLLEPVPKLTSQNYYSWSTHVISFLRSIPHAMEHLEGVYNLDHPKWSTIDTVGEYYVNYLLLDIIREYLTFSQVWSKIKNGLGNEATRASCRLALITQLGDARMFHADAQKFIQEIRVIQAEGSICQRSCA
ncbi:uncharacterized protein UDID_18216 [Ustilago sp. UG-2017a]|nr:uncharacterized protein UDID_18216 [Ustilago sp. UG-2017a]